MKTADAKKYFGSRTRLAYVLGLTPIAITMWGDEVPELRAYELDDLTNGDLKHKSRFKRKEREIAIKYHLKALDDKKWKEEEKK